MTKNYTFQKRFTALVLLCTTSIFAQAYDSGIFVLNEGGAGSSNATVSFLNPIANTITNGIYASVNPNEGALGDTAQSLSYNGDDIYIVLNVSNTIKIVKKGTFEYLATVNAGLSNPRYMAFANGKGYITNWGSGIDPDDDYVAILDLSSNTVTATIPMAEGVERILELNGKLYVAHQGGYGFGNTVSVIDPMTDTVTATIPVSDVPNRLIRFYDNLYVLCGGIPDWSGAPTDGALVQINTQDNSIISHEVFAGLHPANLQITADTFFYTSGANIYSANVSNPMAYTQIASLEDQGVYGIYGMDLIDSQLYVSDAGDYASPGKVFTYSTSGELQHQYNVGVIPNGCYKAEAALATTAFKPAAATLYPNPASTKFYLSNGNNAAVRLYDYAGRLVLQQEQTQNGVDVSVLSGGVYRVQIASGQSTTTQKLIVK